MLTNLLSRKATRFALIKKKKKKGERRKQIKVEKKKNSLRTQAVWT